MTPAARIQAGIELWDAIEAAPRAPADAIATAFFRARRYVGAADRREVSERAWAMLRGRSRLTWYLKQARAPIGARTMILAQLVVTEAGGADAVAGLFNGAQHGPAPLAEPERRVLKTLSDQLADDPAMTLTDRFGVPEWLIPSLRARFGTALEAELAGMDAPAPTDLRANLLKTTREDAARALAAEGIETDPTKLSPWGLRVRGRRAVTATKAFKDGLVEIQDEGSQLLALLVDARPGLRVADFCAGAGGKTLALAATMGNRGQIVATDTHAARLEAATRRLRRAGVSNVERRLLEPGSKWVKRASGGFDRVLVDAPCTGSGTWRRNPEARHRLRADDLAELTVIQNEVLDRAARLVKAGGLLVYATCSLLAEENETQVLGFLDRHADFAAVPLSLIWGQVAPEPAPCADPFLALTPAQHGTDGFFAAVMRRTGPPT